MSITELSLVRLILISQTKTNIDRNNLKAYIINLLLHNRNPHTDNII